MIEPKNILPGQEALEFYKSAALGRRCLEYNYRAADGRLFVKAFPVRGTEAEALAAVRLEKDAWVADIGLPTCPLSQRGALPSTQESVFHE